MLLEEYTVENAMRAECKAARADGLAEGRAAGRAEGRAEGLAIGETKGIKKRDKEILDLINQGFTLEKLKQSLEQKSE